jgi:hypothetical protein
MFYMNFSYQVSSAISSRTVNIQSLQLPGYYLTLCATVIVFFEDCVIVPNFSLTLCCSCSHLRNLHDRHIGIVDPRDYILPLSEV